MDKTHNLTQFRQQVYQNFTKRADTLMELLDALCSQHHARHVVELSLEAAFRRHYTALFQAVREYRPQPGELAHLAAEHLPAPKKRAFWLIGADVTSQPREYAATLAERTFVYKPGVIQSNKPVTIGHQYSTVALLPEKNMDTPGSWVVPLSCERVPAGKRKFEVGKEQIDALLSDPKMPFHGQLVVEVVDSDYARPDYLAAHRKHPNLVTIVRSRSNRVFYRQNERRAAETGGAPGHYGAAFRLRDPATWHAPDDTLELPFVSRRGKHYTVHIQAWHNMLMRGKNKPRRLPMHPYPFTLVRIVLLDENGQPAFKRPLWLLVFGERRHELTLQDIYEAYAQRSDLEHFFRFGKQHLLLDKFQTPETEREAHWWYLVHLAYLQLWVARHAAVATPRPWEKYLPHYKQGKASPAAVQRDFRRLLRTFGTPARPPKPRGKSPGRAKGTRLPPRKRHKVLKKGSQTTS
jgi:hypothetical protein